MLNELQVKEIKERGLYDYIVNHYYEMSKEELKNMFKEFIHAVYSDNLIRYDKAVEEMIEEVNDMY